MDDWDLLITDAALATMQPGEAWGAIPNGAIAVRDGRIDWVGPQSELPRGIATRRQSASGRWLTPALIDCHTHLLFGGNRAAEFEQRLNGASYEEIARAGGGIMSTVRATRAATDEDLLAAANERIASLQLGGVATVEIKSGYGLDLDTELRLLKLARHIGDRPNLTVRTSFLGAHTVPTDFDGDTDAYVDFLCNDVLPAVHQAKLADAVDGYCESIAFSASQIERVFERARSFGLPVKLHADQLSDCGGAELAARYGALSADHLEYSSDAGIDAMANAGCVAVLLPGAYITLRETQAPPVAKLREAGVPIAIASDCNPGTSPVASLNSMMTLATSQFRLTPEECLAGVTRNAARALGLQDDTGMLAPGLRADFAEWDIEHPAELSYWLGLQQLQQLTVGGITVDA